MTYAQNLADSAQTLVSFIPPNWFYNLTNDGGSWGINYWYEISL